MAFYGSWSDNRYYVINPQPEVYNQLWQSIRYDLPQIQGFEFELRDQQESYAVLSKQAIALGRSDLLNEALAGVQRVNTMREGWSKLNGIINAYNSIWPGYWVYQMGQERMEWKINYYGVKDIAGIRFGTPYDALEYVSVYWPPLKDQFSQEYYTLRQLEKRFTPAIVVAVPEPYIPLRAVTTTPISESVTSESILEEAVPSVSIPEEVTPLISIPQERATMVTDIIATTPISTSLALQEQVQLAGLPTWTIVLLAGAGIFMFLGKGKSMRGKIK